jgi:hypothetical protein
MGAVLRALEAGGAIVPGAAATMAPTTLAEQLAKAPVPVVQPQAQRGAAWPLPPPKEARIARGTPSPLPVSVLPGLAPHVAGSNTHMAAVKLFPVAADEPARAPGDFGETVPHRVFDYAELTDEAPAVDSVEIEIVADAEADEDGHDAVLHAPASLSAIVEPAAPFAANLLAARMRKRTGVCAIAALIVLVLALLATLVWHTAGSGTAEQTPAVHASSRPLG